MTLRVNMGEIDDARRIMEEEAEGITDPAEQCRLAIELVQVSAARELAEAINRLAMAVEAQDAP